MSVFIIPLPVTVSQKKYFSLKVVSFKTSYDGFSLGVQTERADAG